MAKEMNCQLASDDRQLARGNGHGYENGLATDEDMALTEEVQHAFDRVLDEVKECRKDVAEMNTRLVLVEDRFKWVDIIAKSAIIGTVTSVIAALMIKIAEAWHALNK